MLSDLHILADADVCYLTTTGRVSGRPHRVYELVVDKRTDMLHLRRRAKHGSARTPSA